ncbi:MAG: hypothetical protein AB7K24_31505, partial [Gemmataceae bacterium]
RLPEWQQYILSFGAEGRVLAVAGRDWVAYQRGRGPLLYDLPDGRLRPALPLAGADQSYTVWASTWSADGWILAAGCGGAQEARLWDIRLPASTESDH